MFRILIPCLFVPAIIIAAIRDSGNVETLPGPTPSAESIALSVPILKGSMTLEEALSKRRSVREFKNTQIKQTDISQILWAAQGITDKEGLRTAPSAGALYPLEIRVIAERVEGLEPGIYRYVPDQHTLQKISSGSNLSALAGAAHGQTWAAGSSAAIVIAGVYARTTGKYGERGIRYVHMEVGCAAQNIYLQATALNLGTTFVGAFDDNKVKRVVQLQSDEEPLAILPIGVPAK